MNYNRETIFLFFIFLAILIGGFIVGRQVGLNEANSYYQTEETMQDICDYLEEKEMIEKSRGKPREYTIPIFNLSFE